MKIGVKNDIGKAADAIKSVPPAGAVALSAAMNTTVKRAQFDVVASMREVFSSPTPYALGGLRTDQAAPQRLKAAVMVRGKPDVGGGAVPAESFLRAEIEGGERAQKRMEVALQRVRVLPWGWRAVPAEGARLDAYGNMSRGQVIQIISYFQGFQAGGYRANTSAKRKAALLKGTKSRRGTEYFAVAPGTKGLRPGVWERREFGAAGKGVRCVLLFVTKTSYRKRLDFYGVVDRSIQSNLEPQFDAELRKALS